MRAAGNILLAAVVLACACDLNIPTVHVRDARPGEVHVVRRETMTMTVHKRYSDKRRVALYSAAGIPEFTTGPSIGDFVVVTDDFDRDVPPPRTVVSAVVEIRTNGLYVMQMTPLGVDENYSTTSVPNGMKWIDAGSAAR
jgi:hypothetical protein